MLTVILTGGSSRRMGRDKAMLPYGTGTMLQTLINRYVQLGTVAVSVDQAGRFPFTGAIELPDRYPRQGPMNGILSGFLETDADELLLAAVDQPYGDPELAKRLCELRGSADACVIRRGPKQLEPLFAIYGKGCLPYAEECMRNGRKSLLDLFERAAVRYVAPDELTKFDLERILTNVNTPEAYFRLK